jgi:hypothetical protein
VEKQTFRLIAGLNTEGHRNRAAFPRPDQGGQTHRPCRRVLDGRLDSGTVGREEAEEVSSRQARDAQVQKGRRCRVRVLDPQLGTGNDQDRFLEEVEKRKIARAQVCRLPGGPLHRVPHVHELIVHGDQSRHVMAQVLKRRLCATATRRLRKDVFQSSQPKCSSSEEISEIFRHCGFPEGGVAAYRHADDAASVAVRVNGSGDLRPDEGEAAAVGGGEWAVLRVGDRGRALRGLRSILHPQLLAT